MSALKIQGFTIIIKLGRKKCFEKEQNQVKNDDCDQKEKNYDNKKKKKENIIKNCQSL